jgi:hypothetical protein
MTIALTVLALLLTLSSSSADPEVHLIPAGYVGEVTIAYRAANGARAAWEGGARLYRIPRNGILLTQAEPNTGATPAFFAVGRDGTRVAIRVWRSPVDDTPENRASPDVEIFYPRQGRMQGLRLPCVIEFDQYFVGTRAQLLDRKRRQRERDRTAAYLAANLKCR